MMKASKNETPKQERILKAAEAVFSRRGYTQATLDEIITLADTGKGTLYKYFGNKDNLFYTLILHKHRSLVVRFVGIATASWDTETKITRYLDLWIKFLAENNVLWQVLIFEMTGGSQGFYAERNLDGTLGIRAKWGNDPNEDEKARLERYYQLLMEEAEPFENIFVEGRQRGFFKESVKPLAISRNLLFSVAMIAFHYKGLQGEVPEDLDAIAPKFTKHFLYGMAKNQPAG